MLDLQGSSAGRRVAARGVVVACLASVVGVVFCASWGSGETPAESDQERLQARDEPAEEPSDAELALYDTTYEFFLENAFPMPGPGITIRYHGSKAREFYTSLTWGTTPDGAPQILAHTVEPIGDAVSSQMMSAIEASGVQTRRDIICAVNLQESRLSSTQCPAIRELFSSFRPEWVRMTPPVYRDPKADIPVIADGQTVEVSIRQDLFRSGVTTDLDEKSQLFQWALHSSSVLHECMKTVAAKNPGVELVQRRKGCSS